MTEFFGTYSQQASRAERGLARRDHHERVRRHRIGPRSWQREQLPVLVVQVDPVLAPVLAAGDELEVPAGQRVERVGHPDAPVPIVRIGCSRRCGATRSWNAGLAAAGVSCWTGP